MKSVFSSLNSKIENAKIIDLIENFDTIDGGEGDRNIIKIVDVNGVKLNIKAFKTPNVVNKIVYNFFRKSKAQRSFEYAIKLTEMGIGTPRPIAYFEYENLIAFGKSYYISEQQDCDITYRKLIKDFNYPDYDNILRAFTRFTYNLHEKGIHFLDHSPGNTLIKKNGSKYDFYLVDLNRMNFGVLDFKTRMKNFGRLSKHKEMVEVMSDEYAKCIDENYDKVFTAMWKEVQEFRGKIKRKKELKKKFKF